MAIAPETKTTIDDVFSLLSTEERDDAGFQWDNGFWEELTNGGHLSWLTDKLSDKKVNIDSIEVMKYVEEKCAECY